MMVRDNIGTALYSALVFDVMNKEILSLNQLKYVMYYMRMIGLIAKETYDKVEMSLLSEKLYVKVQYANGKIAYSHIKPENEVGNNELFFIPEETEDKWDIFNPVEYSEWVIEQLCKDIYLNRKVVFQTFTELISGLSGYKFPVWYMLQTEEFVTSTRNAILTGEELFYLHQTEHFTYELHYQNLKNIRVAWSIKDGEVLKKGLSQHCYYVKNPYSEYIYCGIEKTDSYYRFDVKNWKADIIHNIIFLGINGKGQEVVVLQKKFICVLAQQEVKIIREYSKDMRYKVCTDYVLAWPRNRYGDACRPVCLYYDGSVTQSNAKDAAAIFWSELIDSQTKICNLKYSRSISDMLILERIEKAPDILTIHNLKRCYKNVAEQGLVGKERYFPFVNLLKLLERAGMNPDEDITDLMYSLVRYSSLCSRHEWGYSFHRNFLSILRRLSQKKDFLYLLLKEPDILFQDDVCMTHEMFERRQQKYSLPEYAYYWRGLIGTFDVINNNIVYEFKQTDQGTIVDNKICYNWSHSYRGRVYYDLITGQYVINWISDDSALAEEIRKIFHHENDTIHFVFQEKRGDDS